jgi:hypothetical protein
MKKSCCYGFRFCPNYRDNSFIGRKYPIYHDYENKKYAKPVAAGIYKNSEKADIKEIMGKSHYPKPVA